MRPRFGSEQRLAIAFTLLVSTFGLASYLTLVQVRATHGDPGGAALRSMLVFLVVSSMLAIVVGIYVHRSLARPIARLQAGVARIAQGDLDSHIRIDTPDEFGDLARQFNSMTHALKEHQQRLVEHEKMAGIGRLAAEVAHEINNPLTVILGYARLLGRTATGQNASDLQTIEEESLRAKAVVDGLLELAGQPRFAKDRIDPGVRPDQAHGGPLETANGPSAGGSVEPRRPAVAVEEARS